MLFDSAKKIRRVIKLLGHFCAGDDKEIVIVAAGAQIVQFRNSQRKLHIQDAGFDIQSAEITDDAGMMDASCQYRHRQARLAWHEIWRNRPGLQRFSGCRIRKGFMPPPSIPAHAHIGLGPKRFFHHCT